MVFFKCALIVLVKVGIVGTILEKNHCWCEHMVNDLFVLVPHLALQPYLVLQPNFHCVEVDPLKANPLDILKQEYNFFSIVGSINFYFHTILKPTKDSLKMTSFVTTTFQI